jgi:type II secretory pathway component GspD/PulD (secretin)
VRETSENAFAANLPGDAAGADLLRALETSGTRMSVLSRPQVRTLEDRPAQVQVGQTHPVVEGVAVRDDGTAASIIAEATTGVMLAVTPHRTTEGLTTLETQVERSWFEETETKLHIDPASGAATTSPVKSSFSACTEMQSEPGHVVLLAVRPDSRPSAAREARATLIVVLHSRQIQENR